VILAGKGSSPTEVEEVAERSDVVSGR
jgi:hypothetical protein